MRYFQPLQNKTNMVPQQQVLHYKIGESYIIVGEN